MAHFADLTIKTARRWRKVSKVELQQIWTKLHARGEWYAGCTWAELLRMYGEGNVIHKPGKGWYRLTSY